MIDEGTLADVKREAELKKDRPHDLNCRPFSSKTAAGLN
jgi:hypothetical protein